jgi:hypothetical protein
MKFEIENDVSREDLEELLRASESIRPQLVARLEAMTQEATGLWALTHQQGQRIAELEALIGQRPASAPTLVEIAPPTSIDFGELAALRRELTIIADLQEQCLLVCHALDSRLAAALGAPESIAPALDPPSRQAADAPEPTNSTPSAREEQRSRLADLRAKLSDIRQQA